MQNDTISAKEIRQDLIGFLRRIKAGNPITVIYRSKPLVTVTREAAHGHENTTAELMPGSPEAVARSLAYAKQLRKDRKPVLDPHKSIKQLYAETMDEKYGIARGR